MSAQTVQIHPNGFITVWVGPNRFDVQDMQQFVRRQLRGAFDANDSRPSCTCANGFDTLWCAHKTVAYDAVRRVI